MSDSANAQSLTPAEEIAALIKRSRAAQQQIEHYTQEQVDDLIRAMVWAVAKPGVAEEIADLDVVVDPEVIGGVRIRVGDVVIDASGRRTRFPQWFAQSGCDIPEEKHDAELVYYTRHFFFSNPFQLLFVSVPFH